MFDIVNGRLTIAGKAAPFVRTPNQGGRLEPTLIVLHDTAGRLAKGSSVAWLCNPKAKASAHLVVERDGSVTQLVEFDRVAWHAGQSSWRGRSGCNAFAIGIEIVNPGKLTGTPKKATAWFGESYGPEFGIARASSSIHGNGCWMPYTEDQLRTVERLIAALAREYPIGEVVAHHDISPGRKVDTTPLMDWPRMRAVLESDCGHERGSISRNEAVAVGTTEPEPANPQAPRPPARHRCGGRTGRSPGVRGRCDDPLGVGHGQDQQRGRAKAARAVGAVALYHHEVPALVKVRRAHNARCLRVTVVR
jgi:N-acetylmuramoyl-L-alanine amidase